MKRYLMLVGLWVLTLNGPVNAQDFTHEFGKYTGEEFQMDHYPKDPSAEAVVIYDIGTSYFKLYNDGYYLIFERKTKVKIFRKSGLKYARFEIPFYIQDHNEENIQELEGNTYNFENGTLRVSPLDPKNTYTEKESENWNVRKFAMPDVKEGSVIEVRYKIASPYFFNFRSWKFQNTIPVIYSEYVTRMIPFYEYRYVLQGDNKFDSYREYEEVNQVKSYEAVTYHDMIYEFIMRNVPAFKDEAFIASPEDYLIKLDFQLSAYHYLRGGESHVMTTWPKLISDFLDHDSFGKYLKAAQKKSDEITDTMKLSGKSDQLKVEYLDKYVKLSFNWNRMESKFSSKSVKDFLKTKTGNSADLNLFYAGILNSAGVEAYPVLISTRDHGKIKRNYPFQHFFNQVIVAAKIEGQYVLLDATDPLSRPNEIPSWCLNDKGLIVKSNKDKYEWVDLKSSVNSDITYTINLFPDFKNDSVNGSFCISSIGYDAIPSRKKFIGDTKQLKVELSTYNLVLTDSIRCENLNEINKPFNYKFKGNLVLDRVEDKILITPFCNFNISDNPLKQAIRNYPVDINYRRSKTYITLLHIPQGYKLYNLPIGLTIDNDEIRIKYLVEPADNNLVKITGIYDFKKAVYEIASYPNLKKYFDQIIGKFNEKIILVKKD